MDARLECDNDCFDTQRDEIERVAAATHGGSRQCPRTKTQDVVVVSIWVLELQTLIAVGLFSF